MKLFHSPACMLGIAVLAGVAGGAGSVFAQQGRAQSAASTDVHVLKVQGSVYMLVGPGGNVTLQAGKDGVLLVDSMNGSATEKLLAAVRTISDKQLRYIINTSFEMDHTGGNETLAKLGAPVLGGNLGNSNKGAAILARENVLNRMSAPAGQKAPRPEGAWPTVYWFEGNKEVFFNGEAVEVLPVPPGHTDGDSIVYFRRSDVISTGDIFRTDTYPVIDLEAGGNIQGVLDGLNHVLDIAIPEHEQEGGTYIIPGHGRLCDEHDVLEYRDMVTIVRDRIQNYLKKGMTLDQIKAAKPTFEYDRRYGTTPGATTAFVEAVYKSLAAKK
jgi:glyoxylase-like metal-dependent hydrolase (beta-lactamase superfamily II)